MFFYHNADGDDLSSSYIACRLLAEGKESHLYSHDPEYFHIVNDPVWIKIAQEASFRGFLHPYVQAPLWAFVLIPLCRVTNFQTFNFIFLLINFSSLAATIWLVSYQWARTFLAKPLWLLGFLFVFSLMTPTYYMAFLNQTHPLFLFATILAVLLASYKRDLLSGLSLAIAVFIKITPVIIVFYWLISGRRKSVVSFVVWSLVLSVLSILTLGLRINMEYLSNLGRISNTLLVSFNNQSFAAWLYGRLYNMPEILYWRIHPLAVSAKITSFFFVGLTIGYFALLYQRKQSDLEHLEAMSVSSLLIASTIFTPIAWTHYYIVLLVPLLILMDRGLQTKKMWLIFTVVILVLLDIWPIAIDPLNPQLYPFTILRSHFYAGVICLCALLIHSKSLLNKSNFETNIAKNNL
jgi:hypothetical protein